MAIMARLAQAWNAFRSNDDNPNLYSSSNIGPSTSIRPYSPRSRYSNEKSIVAAVYARMAIDVASIGIRHVKLDDQGRYSEDMDTSLNDCLTFEANIDQAPRAFRQDIALTLFEEGVAAIVPVDTTLNPLTSAKFDILNMRVGRICAWYPTIIRVSLYNEKKGYREDILVSKKSCAIVENPLYAVMNEPNSTLQRLIRKLNILDAVDEQSGSGKLDIIIQVPYTIKSEARRQQAEKRKEDIEFQMRSSQYGIAYTDATEKIVQLNRPAENNLLKQIEYLNNLLYNQLGITDAVMNGTADETAMNNYYSRTIEPIMDSVVEAMRRSFVGLVKNEDIRYYRDRFKLIPLKDLAEIVDKLTRNEVASSNEIRGFIGLPPSNDPKADLLINSNMPQPDPNAPAATSSTGVPTVTQSGPTLDDLDGVMNDVLNGLSSDLDKVSGSVGDG